jgi:dynein heavy chain
MAALSSAQATLKAVLDKIAKLEAQFTEANEKKEDLARQFEEASGRLERAGILTESLGSESVRWTESCKRLTAEYGDLVGDALISASTIAYAGAFTPDFRKRLVELWRESLVQAGIPHTPGCNITGTVSDQVLLRNWKMFELPQDAHSIENAIMMSQGRRYSLFIDPQGQANKFIKNMGKQTKFAENGLDVIKLSDKTFLRTLENGVRFGKWVLLENVGESLDASLETLLLQQKFKQGGQEMIKIGDSVIPWNDSFNFFITTKLPNPHYPPEVCVKVSLLNFAITFSGLEDQLLGVTVVQERPDMEEKKNSLIIANARMQNELADIESTILRLLKESSGNILDDVELINTLASSKKTSEEINAKVAEASVTEKEIDTNRELYRPVAFHVSILYFCIADLSIVDPMYQFSLQWFTNLFVQGCKRAEAAENFQERLQNLQDFFTYYLYCNICRSLFEKDKLLFSFVMTVKILQGHNLVDPAEWRFLISGTTGSLGGDDLPQGYVPPDWVDKRMFGEVCALGSLPAFKGFSVGFTTLVEPWRHYYDATEPQNLPLPGVWNEQLNTFQKLCALRCLRVDKVPDAIMTYVVEKMGKKYVEPPPFHLASCYEDSSCTTPLIFVLSKGSDPTKNFLQFAAEMKFDKKLNSLSLGQGQNVKAKNLIEGGSQKGFWVLLANCHLYISWMTELERLCEELTPETTHKDFRLWLTSMPTEKFPVSVLQNGVKMINEPPKGLKANLKSAYFKFSDAQLQATQKPETWRKLLFGMRFFHAVAQERRKFGPLGWNRPYEFNDTDVDISQGQLEIFIDAYDDVPYRVIQFLTSYINYGGRVTDAIDIRTMDVIMKMFCNPELLEDSYKFDSYGIYTSVPSDPETPRQSYLDYIETLPTAAGPAVFGLHENANIMCAQVEAFDMFNTILLMSASSGSGGGGGASREDIIGASAADAEARLLKYGLFDNEQISLLYPVKYDESMNTVLLQECIRFNKLIGVMQESLPMLRKALKGLVVMSSELDAMGNNIFVNAVPKLWEDLAYPSMKPYMNWVDDLMQRLQFVHDWVDGGIPPVFWVSGFYFPQGFFTAILQNYARKYRHPIDTIDFDFFLQKPDFTTNVKPENGAYIQGLFMEGARWDAAINSINDSLPKQLYTELPTILLDPVKDREATEKGVYRLPIYKILSRAGVLATTGHSTNFVMWMEIPSNRTDIKNHLGEADQKEWIMGGVAAFCALKY